MQGILRHHVYRALENVFQRLLKGDAIQQGLMGLHRDEQVEVALCACFSSHARSEHAHMAYAMLTCKA